MKAGARIVMADVQSGDDIASKLGARFELLDVSDATAFKQVLSEVTHSAGKLDVLINNAGINGEDGITIQDSDPVLMRKVFEVNTTGVYHGLKFGPQYMNDGGVILNTTSLGASYVFPGSGPYSASKAAVTNLTTMAAAELASRKIRVNAVAPAFTRTPMSAPDIELFMKIGKKSTHAGRIAEPEEVAAVFHFLASDDASYVNGQVINVDAGMALGFTQSEIQCLSE